MTARIVPFLLPWLLAPGALADAPLTGAAAYGDWHADAPGVVRHITADAMPPPNATLSAHRAPSVVTRPAGALLHVPPGFEVEPFAAGLERPRLLRVAPNGDVFVAESDAGRVRVLRATAGATGKPQSNMFAEGLSYPFGIAFWPPGPDPRFVYVAATDQVVRFAYRPGDLRARGKPQIVVPHLPVGGHATRDLVFSPDGRSMFVSVGSEANIATRSAAARRRCRTRLGRSPWPRRRLGQRAGPRRRAGVRSRRRQPAQPCHRPAQLHRRGDPASGRTPYGAW